MPGLFNLTSSEAPALLNHNLSRPYLVNLARAINPPMQITHTETAPQMARISLAITKADYEPAVEKALQRYRRQVRVPGFRDGQAPMGMVRKMYGESVMLEELNRIVNDALNEHLREKALRLIGQPLPLKEHQLEKEMDILDFNFEVGMWPEMEIALPTDSFSRYVVEVSDEELEAEIENARVHFFADAYPETVELGDSLIGTVLPAQEDGSPDNNATKRFLTIRTGEVSEAAAAPFLGAKKGDIVPIDLKALYGESLEDIAKGLNVSVDTLGDDFPSTQTFTVNRLLRVGKAPLDQTLFDKVLGPEVVDNEENFRMAFRSAIADQADKASEQRLVNDILSATLGQNEIYLPEDWVVRTIIEGAKEDEKPAEEEVRKYYHDRHANEMRVSFVTTRILEQAEASITGDDVRERVAEDVRRTYMQYGMAEPDENAVQKATQAYLEKDENAQNVFRSMERDRLASLLLNAVQVTAQVVSLADFRKADQLANQPMEALAENADEANVAE